MHFLVAYTPKEQKNFLTVLKTHILQTEILLGETVNSFSYLKIAYTHR